jgi:hypothetical protein
VEEHDVMVTDDAFTCADLDELTDLVAAAWMSGFDRDWSAPAGSLSWTCTQTADHAIDTVLAPAFFLASRKQDGYPEYGVSTPGPDARPEVLVEALSTATTILVAVVTTADRATRATIWRFPRVELRGPADFVPRGALELILHAHDVCSGLGVTFDPPADLCDRMRRHTRDWPHWTSPGWSPLTMGPDPWADLLRSSGR